MKNNIAINPIQNKIFLELFINSSWFVPSDVLQRSIEASIWNLYKFKNPILEIGIGDGVISKILYRKIKKIDVGIDIVETGLIKAKLSGKYKKVLKENAEKTTFKNSSFNSIISNSTFEHIKNDRKAISEASRILKKNGRLFITVPSNYLPLWVLEYEKHVNSKYAKTKLKSFNKRAEHYHYYSISEWEKILEKNHMEVEFYKFYFSKEVALAWYKMFKIFTKKINNKEIWSYLGYSKISRIMPKKIIKRIEAAFLRNKFKKGFFVNSKGAMLFIIAKKIS